MPGMWTGALLAWTLIAGQPSADAALTLELRVFNGAEEVTAQTRVAIHRAGDRGRPVVLLEAGHRQLTAPTRFRHVGDTEVKHAKDKTTHPACAYWSLSRHLREVFLIDSRLACRSTLLKNAARP